MKLAISLAILCSIGLAGCAQTPVAYKLVESVNYEPGALAGNYRIGVTEEKVSDTEYLITVKLSTASSPKRAASMGIYHASLLAESYGANRFKLGKPKTGGWCSWSENSQTGQRSVNDGGPQIQLKVNFLDEESTQKSNKKIKILKTAKTKPKFFALMNKPLSEEEIDRNNDRRMERCWEKHH